MKRFSRSAVASAFRDTDPDIRRKTFGLFVALLLTTLLLWTLVAVLSYASSALVLSIALIAYGLGVIHAFDAPGIAALNATTYAMVQERKRPVALAVFFALGHATGITILCTVLASLDTLNAVPAITLSLTTLGTAAASVFLIVTAWRILPLHRRGRAASKGLHPTSTRKAVLVGAVFSLLLPPSLFLGLVTLSALVAVSGLPLVSIALFGALFAAGMALAGSVNTCLMTAVYWQASAGQTAMPGYGEYIAGYTGIAALFVAIFELGATLVALLDLRGPFGDWLVALRDNTGLLGIVMLIVFLVSWGVSNLRARTRAQTLRRDASLVQAVTRDETQDYEVSRPEDHAATTLPMGSIHDDR